MNNKHVVVEGLGRGGPYSHAVIAGEFVFISGQTGKTDKNINDFKGQFREAMERINKIAQAVGKSIKDIVKVNVYIKDKSYFKELNEVFEEYFKDSPPARTTLVTDFVDNGILVEIDVILH